MPELIYFDLPPRADAIRILLHSAGIKFKDTRLTFAEWSQIKDNTPLGQLPVFKTDDEQFCQSVVRCAPLLFCFQKRNFLTLMITFQALVRYCARLNGLYPAGLLEALVVDEAIDTMSDVLMKIPSGKDEDERKMNRRGFQEGFMTASAKLLEARIQKYGGGKGFLSSFSVADLFLLGFVQIFEMGFFEHIDPKFFDAYPGIT